MRLVIPGKDERGDAALCAAIRADISASGGRISFARFMTHALQHPVHGYYRRGRTRAGHGGDFHTSPEAHPAFGGAMARQLEILGEALDVPEPVWVEAGAGVGTLAGQVGRVIAVDTAGHVHEGVHGEGGGDGKRVIRVRAEGLPFAEGSVDGVYANELLDAFPVHRLRRDGDRWREAFVVAEGDRFAWSEGDPLPEALAAAEAARKRVDSVSDGQRVEVCPSIAEWIAEAARVVRRGFVLLVDYGDDTPGLWAPSRAAGTLRCFAGHAVHDDPLAFVGTQDITAHVDFGAVFAAARASGFEAVAWLDQRAWLDGFGVLEAAAGLAARAAAGDMRADEAEVNLHAVNFLADPRGLGRVRVLALAKGVKPMLVPGLTGPVPASRRFRADDLPLTKLPDPFADLY